MKTGKKLKPASSKIEKYISLVIGIVLVFVSGIAAYTAWHLPRGMLVARAISITGPQCFLALPL